MSASNDSVHWSRTSEGDPEVEIHFDGRRVYSEGLDSELDVDVDAWREGAFEDLVCEAFGLEVWVTLCALVERELSTEPPPRGPRLRFSWDPPGERRGWIRLRGRTLGVRGFGEDDLEWEVDIDEIAGDEAFELPAEVAAFIGDEQRHDVLATARRAASLACFCGTGFDEPDEHGALVSIERASDPAIPLDNGVSSHICEVCRRGWVWSYIGDSHYSYDYQTRWIDPNHTA